MSRSEIIQPDISLDVIAPGGRIGLIALATDFNSEQELRRIFPHDVEIFTNRVLNASPVTLENLRGMAGDISRAAAGILPDIQLDAMIYGCTSGTVANGAEKIEQLIHKSCPGVPVTNPASAALAAFAHFGAQRISILTPYTEPVNLEMARYFEQRGIEVINIVGLGYENDMDMTGIPPQAIAEAAKTVCDANAELLFISCTAIRAAAVIEEIEQAITRPVVSSNQALVWHSLKLIGCPHSVRGYGSLFQQC
ncbi:MAG: Asp/Glu racemase [Gammaproteobacteria bacterium]